MSRMVRPANRRIDRASTFYIQLSRVRTSAGHQRCFFAFYEPTVWNVQCASAWPQPITEHFKAEVEDLPFPTVWLEASPDATPELRMCCGRMCCEMPRTYLVVYLAPTSQLHVASENRPVSVESHAIMKGW